MTTKTKAYAASSAKSALAPFSFTRRDVLPDDVKINILFCGVRCQLLKVEDAEEERIQWFRFLQGRSQSVSFALNYVQKEETPISEISSPVSVQHHGHLGFSKQGEMEVL